MHFYFGIKPYDQNGTTGTTKDHEYLESSTHRLHVKCQYNVFYRDKNWENKLQASLIHHQEQLIRYMML